MILFNKPLSYLPEMKDGIPMELGPTITPGSLQSPELSYKPHSFLRLIINFLSSHLKIIPSYANDCIFFITGESAILSSRNLQII